MENEKLDENKMEGVTGGYTSKKSVLKDGTIALLSIKVDGKEHDNLEMAHCIEHLTDKKSGEDHEYIRRENLGKALEILNQKESFIFPHSDINHERDIKIIF